MRYDSAEHRCRPRMRELENYRPPRGAVGCTSDRDRDRVLLHRVDPGGRNPPSRDELILRAVAQRISRKSEYDEVLSAAVPSGRQRFRQPDKKGINHDNRDGRGVNCG